MKREEKLSISKILIEERKKKENTQKELAVYCGVTNSSVSKWERGLSVPDAEMLIRIAQIFEVSVSELLGAKIENESNQNDIAGQLSRINEQLAVKNRRGKLILKIILGIILGIIVLNILLVILSAISFNSFTNEKNVTVTTQPEIVTQTE